MCDADVKIWLLIKLVLQHSNEPAILQILLAKSTSAINCANKNGRTALHVAVYKQYAQCVQILLKYNCNVNSQVTSYLVRTSGTYHGAISQALHYTTATKVYTDIFLQDCCSYIGYPYVGAFSSNSVRWCTRYTW